MSQLSAQSLRLGNLVLFRGKICKVTTLSGDIIRVDEPEVGIVEQAYPKSPIELTPEILEACGFVPCYSSQWQNRYEHKIHTAIEIQMWKQGNIFFLHRGEKLNTIKYLHEVQNGFYFLTGEELTISFPTVKMEEK